MSNSDGQIPSAFSGFGQVEPPVVDFGMAAFRFPLLEPARAACDDAKCVARHAKRGQTHGAFLYELQWGIVEHAGILVPGVTIHCRCHQCGSRHARIEVPHLATVVPKFLG